MNDKLEETTEFPEDMRLFRIGILAGTFGWLILIISLVHTGMNFTQYISMGEIFFGGMTPLNMANFIIATLQPLISAAVLWFILRVIKEILFIMSDIKEFIQQEEAE